VSTTVNLRVPLKEGISLVNSGFQPRNDDCAARWYAVCNGLSLLGQLSGLAEPLSASRELYSMPLGSKCILFDNTLEGKFAMYTCHVLLFVFRVLASRAMLVS
jgi:hypothetical protein